MLTPASVPSLWRLARLDFDPVRQQRVLLYPEGVVLLNETGAAILDLCDGRRSIIDIAATLEERLARWLLMANDRLDGDEIPLTHEFLSLILGVRRAGVTVALHYLEQRGVIQMSRGQIVILDRDGLKASANGTYHEPEAPAVEEAQRQADRASVPGREADSPG